MDHLVGIFRAPVLERAVDERVVLIGDAAHAMTPHQGSGAGQAIEVSCERDPNDGSDELRPYTFAGCALHFRVSHERRRVECK
jgi:hypothetical protein